MEKVFAAGSFEVGIFEAWGYGASHERPAAARDEAAALPDAGGDDELRFDAGREVIAEADDAGVAVWPELQHLDRIAGVEVEHLVALYAMDGGEGVGRRR